MKWQVYNKEEYSEIYFCGDSPRSISEWATVVQANPKCVFWLSPDAFISHGYDEEWLSSVTTTKKNFPQCYLRITSTQHNFDVWATTEMEAFRTLYEMSLYSDINFSGFWRFSGTNIKLPTILLQKLLEKVVDDVWFLRFDFVSACAGRVLAQSGDDFKLTFSRCSFQPPAEEAFVDGMLSKTDINSGCTGLHIIHPSPFSSEQTMTRLIDGQVLKVLSFNPDNSPYSEQNLNSLRNSIQLQSLTLFPDNFTSSDAFALFVSSLHCSSLRRLTIHGWDFGRAAFPVEVFSKLVLNHFLMYDVHFTEPGWSSICEEIPKCKTLESLAFIRIKWWGSAAKKDAAAKFAVDFAQLLKDSPNIFSTNISGFFLDGNIEENNYNWVLYTKHIAPILQHNRLTKNLATLKRKESYQVRGFLVAEAIGRRFAHKPSSCYTVLKANVDVLVSYLSTDEKAQMSYEEQSMHPKNEIPRSPKASKRKR